jgi:F0F1-type ATP synthase membrane subunit b/b'
VTGESGRAESTSSKKPAEKTLRATATALARSAAPALTGKRASEAQRRRDWSRRIDRIAARTRTVRVDGRDHTTGE